MADYNSCFKLILLLYIVKRSHVIEVQCYQRSQHKKVSIKNVSGQSFNYRCEKGEMKQYVNYGRQRLIMRLKPYETYDSLELNMSLYDFDNNTEFKCARECLDCSDDSKILLNGTEIHNDENLDDKDYIIYYENMSFKADCKGYSSYWLLLDGNNKFIQKTSYANVNLDFLRNNTKLICIDYECNTRRNSNTTICVRRIKKYVTFLTYKVDIGKCKQPLIPYLSLGIIVAIHILALLYRILKKPRPQMPLPEEARLPVTYSVAYDHVIR